MLSFTVSTLRIARAPEVSRVSAAQSCGGPLEGVGGDREHGVTVVSTSFQIAGCVGTSLAAGVYGALSASGTARNRAPWAS